MSHVACLLSVDRDKGRAVFDWKEGWSSFEPYALEGMDFEDFQTRARQAREILSHLVQDSLQCPDNVPRLSYELAEAGHELYRKIFRPARDQRPIAKQIRQWLEDLRRTKSVDTLEIIMDDGPWSVPWNVVYDEPPDKQVFLVGEDDARWKPFWGIRYDLTGGRKVNPLWRHPLLRDPETLLVIDPAIRDGLPDEQRQALIDFIQTQQLTVASSKQELLAAVRDERPEIIYWMSHADADPEALILGDEAITPRMLSEILDTDDEQEFGGIAFLNACQTARSADTGSFLDAMYRVGYSGMVGTEHQTINTFANPVGIDFLRAFLVDREPIGKVMRELRAHVPLGLLYGAYCPPHIRVATKDEAFDGDSSIEVVTIRDSSGGSMLSSHPRSEPAPLPLPDQPYRGLSYFDYADRALFTGRDEDARRFATYLDERETRILILHGESGVGKSSFLRAGVAPYLEEASVGYRFARGAGDAASAASSEQSALMLIRATNDPFSQIAQAICSFCAAPLHFTTPLGETVTVDLPAVLSQSISPATSSRELARALRDGDILLGNLLEAVSRRMPYTLVLVIDQCEELFTLAKSTTDDQTRLAALAMLRKLTKQTSNYKIILSLRTEYHGRLMDQLRRGMVRAGAVREYLLTDFDERALVQAIKLPTLMEKIAQCEEVPYAKYRFRYADGVPEAIARLVMRHTTHGQDSVLPLVQVICAQLYQKAQGGGVSTDAVDGTARAAREITYDDFAELGLVSGGLRRHVESLLADLLRGHAADRPAVQELFSQLFIRQPDGTLTSALVPLNELDPAVDQPSASTPPSGRIRAWRGNMGFPRFLEKAQRVRLLRVNSLRIGDEEQRRYVSLGHDALAGIAAQWKAELDQAEWRRTMRRRLAAAAVLAMVMTGLAAWAIVSRRAAVRSYDQAVDAIFNSSEISAQLEKVSPARLAVETYQDLLRSLDQLQAQARRPHDPRVLLAKSSTLNAIARVHDNAQKYELAWRNYEEALRLREQLARDHPTNGEYQRLRANSEMNLGQLAEKRRQTDEARERLETADKIFQQQFDSGNRDAELRRDRAKVWLNLARLDLKQAQGASYLHQAIDACRDLLAVQPRTLNQNEIDELEYMWAQGHWYLAMHHMYASGQGEANMNLRAAVEHGNWGLRTVAGLRDRVPEDQQYLLLQAGLWRQLGVARLSLRESTQAHEDLSKAQKIYETLVARFPENAAYQQDLDATRNNRELAKQAVR